MATRRARSPLPPPSFARALAALGLLAACGGDAASTPADPPSNDEDVLDDMRDAGATGRLDAGATGTRRDAGATARDGGASASPSLDAAARDDAPATPGNPPTGAAPTEASASARGPYEVKTYTSGYPDAPGYADSTIHYPADGEPPYAAVAIVPGFVSPQDSIKAWGPFLASHGIVAMTLGTNMPTDQPPARETALWEAIGTLKGENTRMGSPLNGKVATGRLGTMGWSMGGGGTLLVAQNHPELKATIALCPWNPGYSYAKVKVPALLLATQADILAGGQSQGFYASIANDVPKLLWERAGADHWANNDPAQEKGAVGRYGLAWLKVFLDGDERYRPFLRAMPPNASDYESNVK
ncbi:MAG: hypothetical protein ABW252_02765 [Polyangiales bacterium]